MTNRIFLFLILIFIKYIYCADDILSKFHQNGYKVKDVRIRLISYNKDYVNFLEVKEFKYNRTTTAYNSTINLKVNVEDKLEGLLQVYKFLSNEYRHFPVRFQVNAQKAFNANAGGMQIVKKCGNATGFIFKKDVTYHACNFLIDETQLPPLIPNGKYKVELQLLYLNKRIALLHIFDEVYTPIFPKD